MSAHVRLIALSALRGSRGPVDKPGFTHAGATGSSSLPVTVQSWCCMYYDGTAGVSQPGW